MASFQNLQPSVYHQMEDAIVWLPTDEKLESGAFDADTMTWLAMTNNNAMMWDNGTSSPSSLSQTISNIDPMDREMPHTSKAEVCNAPGFGMNHQHQHASQWHVQDQGSTWQSLDRCCSEDAYSHARDLALQNTPLFSHHVQAPISEHSYIAGPSSSGYDRINTLSIQPPLPDVFASIQAPQKDPPIPSSSTPLDALPQRKSKRCSDDLYTPSWVRNAGPSREGWCGWCEAWFTLRDSAYWYHMHYSHGVSQANSGKRLPAPACYRAFGVVQPVEWEVKCGKCARWMALPPGDKWNTAYFRHTYKCYFKTTGRGDRSGPSSPAKVALSPSRRRLDML